MQASLIIVITYLAWNHAVVMDESFWELKHAPESAQVEVLSRVSLSVRPLYV